MKYKLTKDVTIARPGKLYTGEAGEVVNWPIEIIRRARAIEGVDDREDEEWFEGKALAAEQEEAEQLEATRKQREKQPDQVSEKQTTE